MINDIAFQTNLLALNAAVVEESSAAAESVADQARTVRDLLSFFSTA